MSVENPTDLPDDHPLAGYNGTLDDHESHLDAISQYLDANAEDIDSVFLVINTEDSSDTIPSMREGIDFEQHVWHQLAAHISHISKAYGIHPTRVAKHGCHVALGQWTDPDIHQRNPENGGDE